MDTNQILLKSVLVWAAGNRIDNKQIDKQKNIYFENHLIELKGPQN